jgi:hypothetical protein
MMMMMMMMKTWRKKPRVMRMRTQLETPEYRQEPCR